MKAKFQAVIFDLDGLLVDSEPVWEKGDARFFAKHGKKHAPEINKKIMGMGHREIMEYFKAEYGFEGEREALIAERKALFYELFLNNIVLMDGAKQLIASLRQKSYQLAIATSGHTREKAAEILGKLGILSAFSVLVSGEDVHKSKPAPDIYLKAAALLPVAPDSCLVIEDAPNGVKAGKAAGMTVYGVNPDPVIRKHLKEVGADKVFSTLSEIGL